jgi:hypothetical protein
MEFGDTYGIRPGIRETALKGEDQPGGLLFTCQTRLTCTTDGDVRSPGIGATGVPGAWRWTRGAAKALWLLLVCEEC